MRRRYSPLPDECSVFRTVRRGGGFLPPGQDLPIPEWLEPTAEDAKEAAVSERAPGLSVWDATLTTFALACVWRGVAESDELGFSAVVRDIRRVGDVHGRAIDVVADPLDVDSPEWAAAVERVAEDRQESQRRSAEGHSLIEGIKRPGGLPKKAHRDFRDELACLFSPL